MTATAAARVEGYVSVRVCGQSFGIPVLDVQDVIAQTTINLVPLAPPEVAGSLNLRGRIVTAIDLRRRLKLPPRAPGESFMCDVLWLSAETFEPVPVTLSPDWRALFAGLYRLEDDLLLPIHIHQVLALDVPSLAA